LKLNDFVVPGASSGRFIFITADLMIYPGAGKFNNFLPGKEKFSGIGYLVIVKYTGYLPEIL